MTELTKEVIKDKVMTKRRWTERALVVLYGFQTKDEKIDGSTTHHNQMGFNAFDAEFLSSLAKWVLSGKRLTEKQLKMAQKRIGKYSGQLLRVAQEKS